MNEASIIRYIRETFDGLDVAASSGDTFFIYDPDRNLPPNYQIPFATLVTNDSYDAASNQSRPSVFRLNIGVSKETYRDLLGEDPPPGSAIGVSDPDRDYTVLDQFLPHPVYAPMSWVCVLNPSEATFHNVVQPLLDEAYSLVVSRAAKRTAGG